MLQEQFPQLFEKLQKFPKVSLNEIKNQYDADELQVFEFSFGELLLVQADYKKHKALVELYKEDPVLMFRELSNDWGWVMTQTEWAYLSNELGLNV